MMYEHDVRRRITVANSNNARRSALITRRPSLRRGEDIQGLAMIAPSIKKPS